MFWETRGAFAIVDELGGLVHSGAVSHLALSSYTCELWALISAFCDSDAPLICKSDSKTVVDQVLTLIRTHEVSSSWMHFEWWCFLKTVYLQRYEQHSCPLWVQWIPAHVLEHLPCELISQELALQHNTTWTDIFCNRRADKFAKIARKKNRQLDSITFDKQSSSIGKWQRWLALVSSAIASQPNEKISASSEEPSQEHQSNLSHIHPRELTCAHPTHLFEAVLPKWIWKIPQTECWKSNFNKELPLRSYVVITNLDWKTAIDFFLQIEWCLAEDFKTAFIELAFFFWDGGYRFQEAKTPADVATWLRKCVNQAAKIKSAEMLVRGQISSTEPPQVSIRQIFLLRRARCFRRNFCWGVKKQG